MRISVLNYTGDRANWGCQATSRELLNYLRGVAAPAQVEFHLVPMLNRTRPYYFVQRHLEASVRRALCRNWLGPISALTLLVAGLILHGRDLLRVLRSDVVVFQAEGTMAGTDLLKGTSLLVLPAIAARIFRKKVVSQNQTLFSADPEFEAVLLNCLKTFHVVAVRESASYHYAHRLGVEDVRLIPDTAFLTQPSATQPESIIEPECTDGYFCVAGSSIIQFIPLDALVSTIQRVSDDTGLCPVLLISSKQDEVLRARLAEVLGEIRTVRPDASHNDVARVLADAGFLIGGLTTCPFWRRRSEHQSSQSRRIHLRTKALSSC